MFYGEQLTMLSPIKCESEYVWWLDGLMKVIENLCEVKEAKTFWGESHHN